MAHEIVADLQSLFAVLWDLVCHCLGFVWRQVLLKLWAPPSWLVAGAMVWITGAQLETSATFGPDVEEWNRYVRLAPACYWALGGGLAGVAGVAFASPCEANPNVWCSFMAMSPLRLAYLWFTMARGWGCLAATGATAAFMASLLGAVSAFSDDVLQPFAVLASPIPVAADLWLRTVGAAWKDPGVVDLKEVNSVMAAMLLLDCAPFLAQASPHLHVKNGCAALMLLWLTKRLAPVASCKLGVTTAVCLVVWVVGINNGVWALLGGVLAAARLLSSGQQAHSLMLAAWALLRLAFVYPQLEQRWGLHPLIVPLTCFCMAAACMDAPWRGLVSKKVRGWVGASAPPAGFAVGDCVRLANGPLQLHQFGLVTVACRTRPRVVALHPPSPDRAPQVWDYPRCALVCARLVHARGADAGTEALRSGDVVRLATGHHVMPGPLRCTDVGVVICVESNGHTISVCRLVPDPDDNGWWYNAPALAMVLAATPHADADADDGGAGRLIHRALRPAAPLAVGDFVRLAPGFEQHSDASDGPLRVDSVGRVISVSSRRQHVTALASEERVVAWYARHALVRLLDPDDVSPLGTGTLVRLAAGYEPQEAALRTDGVLTHRDVGVVLTSADSRIFVERMVVGSTGWWYDTAALERVPFPAPAAAAAPAADAAPAAMTFRVGDCVCVAPGFELVADAAHGPLEVGDVGIVTHALPMDLFRVRLLCEAAGNPVPWPNALLRPATSAAAPAPAPEQQPMPFLRQLLRPAAAGAQPAFGSVGVGVATSVHGGPAGSFIGSVVMVQPLEEAPGADWVYRREALQLAVRLDEEPAGAGPTLSQGQLVRLSGPGADTTAEDAAAAARAAPSDRRLALRAALEGESRLREGELGVVTRVMGRRGAVACRRLGAREARQYAAGALAAASAAEAAAAAAPLKPGERCVLRPEQRGPLPSATVGPRLRPGEVGVVVGATAARVRVLGHRGPQRSFRPDALERAPPPRAAPPAPPSLCAHRMPVALRAPLHGHQVGARGVGWPLMAHHPGGECGQCGRRARRASDARCTLGCAYDLCARCLAVELGQDASGAAGEARPHTARRLIAEQHAAAAAAATTAPDAADVALLGALHPHPLAELGEAAAWPCMLTWRDMRWGWACDVCARRHAGPDGRHRCTLGCDWDCCADCAAEAARAQSAPQLAAGDIVTLSAGYAACADAAAGPLRPGARGVVQRVDRSQARAVLVRADGTLTADAEESAPQLWWYARAALLTPDEADAAAAAAAAAATAADAPQPAAAPKPAEPPAGAAAAALQRLVLACTLRGEAPPDDDDDADVTATAAEDSEVESDAEAETHDSDDDDAAAEGPFAEPMRVLICRDDVVGSSLAALGPPERAAWRRPLLVTFAPTAGGTPEEGVDGGGLSREWYAVTARALMAHPMLRPTDNENGEVWFDPAAGCGADILEACAFLGAFMGRALLDGAAPRRAARLRRVTLCGLRVCDALYKHLLGAPLTLDDVADVSRPLAASLRALRDAPPDSITPAMCLGAFVHEVHARGAKPGAPPALVLPLRPGGADIAVTAANKSEFVALKADSVLWRCVERQLAAACAGFHALVPPAALRASRISPRQLRALLCGGGVGFDVAALAAAAAYAAPYRRSHRVVTWLWEVLAEAGPAAQSDFLEFVTGAPSPPAPPAPPLTVAPAPLRAAASAGDAAAAPRLPTAHTCSATLELPPYESKAQLRERLTLALAHKNVYAFH